MADQPVRFTPLGNLDKDSEYKLIGKGNYTDALDVIKQDDEGQVSGTIQPTKRNKHAFSLGSVQAQNKKYRVTVDGDATKNHALKFLSTKRDYRITTGTGPNGEVEFNGTISSLQSNFNASNLPGAFQVSVSGNTMEFELAPYPHYQWYLESVGEDDVEVVCIQEAIPTDLAGPLKDIGSYDLLGDLFVFSTTQDNEPTELEAEIIGVGPTVPNPTPPPNNLLVGPLTSLTFNTPHGLQEGQWIRITDSNAPWLNGIFVVHNVTSTIGVEIVTDTAWGASHPTFNVGQEKVFIHPTGIGEIGVAQKNNSTESWTYTRLLRSVELNFVSKYEIEGHGQIDSLFKKLYFTDDYNKPSIFSYFGDYVADGALNHVSDDNEYRYGDISVQTSLHLVRPAVYMDLDEQIQDGGNLKAGNKYYAVRYVASDGTTTGWSSLSRGVNVYFQDSRYSAGNIHGDFSTLETPKINVIRISNLSPELFPEIEVAVLEDLGDTFIASIFKKETISSESILIEHSGKETEIETVDLADIIPKSDSFLPIKAKSIKSIDSRNVMSNVETLSKIDLSEWVATFRHSIKRKEISEATEFQKGEYQFPENLFDNVGFMLNETYRVGCRVHFKNFGFTDVYHVDDIKVDCEAVNQANPTDNRRNSALPNYDLFNQTIPVDRSDYILPHQDPNYNSGSSIPGLDTQIGTRWRLASDPNSRERGIEQEDVFPNGTSSVGSVYVPYISIEDIDVTYQIPELGYLSVSDAIDSIEFFIGDIPKSVKSSGVGVMGVEWDWLQLGTVPIDDDFNVNDRLDEAIEEKSYLGGFGFPQGPKYITEYPYVTGSVFRGFNGEGNVDRAVNADYPVIGAEVGNVQTLAPRRDFVSFYSGDTYFRSINKDFSGDELIVFGMTEVQRQFRVRTGDTKRYSYMMNMVQRGTTDTYESYSINDQSFLRNDKDQVDGSSNVFEDIGGEPFRKIFVGNTGRPSLGGYNKQKPMVVAEGPVIKLDTPIDLLSSSIRPSLADNYERIPEYSNKGVVYCQIYRDESENYPDKNSTKYIANGSMMIIDPTSQFNSTDLKCGDTFSNSTFIKHRSTNYDRDRLQTAADTVGQSFEDYYDEYQKSNGWNGGMKILCQNRINANMHIEVTEEPSDFYIYPSQRVNLQEWLEKFIYETPAQYNTAYTLLDEVKLDSYKFLDRYKSVNSIYDLPTRIMYSLKKDYGGIYDEYRVFLPLNVKDLDLSFGEINHHEDINGELFTMQPRKYQLQYFNTRGTLQGSNSGVEVVIGDGSVLSRDGQTLSSYGTFHKSSVIKGKSPGGKDVIYWFNQENGLFMRFGADGTVVLSERSGLRSFAANNTRWTENQYTPALNYGIRSVWDDRFKEAIWTFIGVRASKGEWGTLPSNELYSEGDTVTGSTFDNYSFDGVPDVYISLSNHFPIPQSEPGVGSDWETYWVKAEKTNEYYTVFTLAFNELSNGFSTFYSHLPKTYLKWKNKFLSSHPTERSEIYEHRYGYDKWYEYEGVWKESEPFLEGVVNPFPDQSKKFVAIQALSDNVPDRIELTTKDHESFLISDDFDPEDDTWRTPIKNDILTSQTGDPNDDTESLVGAYMRVKFKFFNGAYNKLNNLVVKVRQRLRRTQS
jgi:hypothetical protein